MVGEESVSLDSITIKGFRQGTLVTLSERDWSASVRALEAHLDANPAFFRGGRIALDVGPHRLSRSEIEKLHTQLARREVELWALISTSRITEAAARELGLVVDLGPAGPRKQGVATEVGKGPSIEGIVVRRTLRSGQSLRHPGHIVVIGDVNPGSEVVAGGNIVIWGRVRGLVHAGALGNEEAIVCALDLSPMQLRIADHIVRSPEERRSEPVPEMASIHNGQIVAIPWYDGRRDKERQWKGE